MTVAGLSARIGAGLVILLASSQIAWAAPAPAPSPAPRCRAAAIGADAFCEIDGARLHFIDWGGEGPPLILLAGFGDTAHAFDDLAPRLTGGHRVYALTRRGFGQSARTPGDYGAERMARDVTGMMDALGLKKADLVGHSIAGAELVLVASAHPERVGRLVYLDAAYNRSNALTLEAGDPLDRTPPAAALTSYAAFAAWRRSALGVETPSVEANVRDQFVLRDGRLAPRTSGAELREIAMSGLLTVAPAYAAIPAPSLALYASKDRLEQAPGDASPQARERSRLYGLRHVRPWMLREQARFLETAPCGVALEIAGSTHYFYLREPDRSARIIQDFLSAASPCDWTPDR